LRNETKRIENKITGLEKRNGKNGKNGKNSQTKRNEKKNQGSTNEMKKKI
jgi:hypothetical protein